MNDDNKQSVQKQFGDVAANYATSAVHVSGADLEVMLSALPLNTSMHILDAGCGAGHTALAFAPHVAQVTAYDLTPAMLAQVDVLAQSRNINNVQTQQGDVEALPFDDATFDLVVSRYSAHHWPHPLEALHEFKRVLKRGGTFILSDVVSFADITADTYLQAIEVLRDPSHARDHTVDQWSAMFAIAGFTVMVRHHFDVPLEFASWHTRMDTPTAQVTAIKTLLSVAPPSVQSALKLPDEWQHADDFSFTLPGAVMIGSPKFFT